MRGPWLAAALVLLGAACRTPPPRIPFQKGGSDWSASVLASEWVVNKDFGECTRAIGSEVILEYPGTNGWAWELGFRYAEGESDGRRLVYGPHSTIPLGAADRTGNVPSEREIQFYELDIGVRQYYPLTSRIQPYFGVGGSILHSRSEEFFVQPAIASTNVDNPFKVDTPVRDHERSEYRPGIYGRVGLVVNLLRDQLREDTEFPVAFDVRGLLSIDYSYLEFSVSFGYAR